MDITINILPLKRTIKATLKGRVLGVSTNSNGTLTVYLDYEAMNNLMEFDELEGIEYSIGDNYIRFYPRAEDYEVSINF